MRIAIPIAVAAVAMAATRWFQYRLDMPPVAGRLLTLWSLAAYLLLVPIAARSKRAVPYLTVAVVVDALLLLCILVARNHSEPAFTTANYLPVLQLVVAVPGAYLLRVPPPRPRWFMAALGLYASVAAFSIHLASPIFTPAGLQPALSSITLLVVVTGMLLSVLGVFAIAVRRA